MTGERNDWNGGTLPLQSPATSDSIRFCFRSLRGRRADGHLQHPPTAAASRLAFPLTTLRDGPGAMLLVRRPGRLNFRCAVLIDNPDKVHSLIANLESNLPLRARITPRLAESLREKSPGTVVPQECDVAAVHYAGDEGGILCALDFGDDTMKEVHIVSITHLAFHRGSPYARDIEVYQRHRIKKIRRLQFRG